MIRIVPMDPGHTGQIADLEKLCFTTPWSEKSVREELSNPLSLWLVAVDGDRTAGYIGSQTVLDETDMMNVAVDPAYRRQGIGRMLIEALIPLLKEKGSRCLTLEVRASNAPAIGLYTGLGFSQIGRRPGYYRGPREDALILRKKWTL